MTNLYHGTVKQLLERVSCVMIDKEAVEVGAWSDWKVFGNA